MAILCNTPSTVCLLHFIPKDERKSLAKNMMKKRHNQFSKMWINCAQTAGKKDEKQILLAKVFWIGDNLVSNDPRTLAALSFPAKIRTTLAAMSGALKSRLWHSRSYCMAHQVFELDGESYVNCHWYPSYRVSVH